MITPLATATPETDTHRTLFEIIVEFFTTGFDFLKYIFYDVFLGVAP